MTARRWLWWALLSSPGLVPFAAPYPPFQDWPGHLGVIGALYHLDDPAARITEFYTYTGGLKPNALFYWLAVLLAQVFGPLLGANIVFSISLASLGPAMARLCTAVGADPRLAVLALPLAIGRHVYCGFVPNAAALPVFILAVAAFFELRRAPRWRTAGLLAALLLLIHALHAFVYLAGGGLLLGVAALDVLRAPRKGAAMGLAAVVASAGAFVPHLLRMDARAGAGPGAAASIWSAAMSVDRSDLAQTLWQWLFASYRYTMVDDVLQAAWLVALLAVVAAAAALRRRQTAPPSGAWLLVVMVVVTLVMFAALPSWVGPPLNWWGGNLRLPVIAALLLVPLGGLVPARWPRLFAGVAALCGFVVALAVFDLATVSRTEMAGFAEVIDAIPPGQRVTAMHYTPHHIHEYPGEPHGYVSNYYLLEKGGFVPQNFFEHPDVPFARKHRAPAPPWAMAEYFDWFKFGVGYDAFILRVHETVEHAPLHGSNQTRVELVLAAGNWRYYRPLPAP